MLTRYVLFCFTPLFIAVTSLAQEQAPPTKIEPSETDAASDVISGPNGDAGASLEEEEPLTQEQKEAIQAFVRSREEWANTLVELKTISIKFSNEEDRSPEAKEKYREVRERGREQMNRTFDLAVKLFKSRPRDFESGSMMATILDYRESTSQYENSNEAAELLLANGLTYPFLYKIAARSAFLDGKFDDVLKHYEAFVSVNGVDKLDNVDNVFANSVKTYPPLWAKELEIRGDEAKADDLPRVLLETTRGPVTIELFENEAPIAVANFITLVEDGYYDGADFYQVVDDFLAMGGDPVGDGTGTSGKFISDENTAENARQFFRGSIAMAKMPDPRKKGDYVPNSASSQFAIALVPLIREDIPQTVFGRVIDGMDVVCTFRRIDPQEKKEKAIVLPPDRILNAKIIRKRDHAYEVPYVK